MDIDEYEFDTEYAFKPDEFDLRPEHDIYTRVAPMETGGIERTKGDIVNDPTQRFYIYVDAIARQLIQTGKVGFRTTDIKAILAKIPSVPAARYKNPTAFVFGYDLTRSGSLMAKKITDAIAVTKDLDVVIRPEDLLRYSFLWLRLIQ